MNVTLYEGHDFALVANQTNGGCLIGVDGRPVSLGTLLRRRHPDARVRLLIEVSEALPKPPEVESVHNQVLELLIAIFYLDPNILTLNAGLGR